MLIGTFSFSNIIVTYGIVSLKMEKHNRELNTKIDKPNQSINLKYVISDYTSR